MCMRPEDFEQSQAHPDFLPDSDMLALQSMVSRITKGRSPVPDPTPAVLSNDPSPPGVTFPLPPDTIPSFLAASNVAPPRRGRRADPATTTATNGARRNSKTQNSKASNPKATGGSSRVSNRLSNRLEAAKAYLDQLPPDPSDAPSDSFSNGTYRLATVAPDLSDEPSMERSTLSMSSGHTASWNVPSAAPASERERDVAGANQAYNANVDVTTTSNGSASPADLDSMSVEDLKSMFQSALASRRRPGGDSDSDSDSDSDLAPTSAVLPADFTADNAPEAARPRARRRSRGKGSRRSGKANVPAPTNVSESPVVPTTQPTPPTLAEAGSESEADPTWDLRKLPRRRRRRTKKPASEQQQVSPTPSPSDPFPVTTSTWPSSSGRDGTPDFAPPLSPFLPVAGSSRRRARPQPSAAPETKFFAPDTSGPDALFDVKDLMQLYQNQRNSAAIVSRPSVEVPPPTAKSRSSHIVPTSSHENPYEKVVQEAPAIEAKLGYRFRDKHLLALAFVHSSLGSRVGLVTHHPLRPMLNNERLELIGDAVFSLLVADHLYRSHPYSTEGEITQLRSHLVCTKACASYVQKLSIAQHLQIDGVQTKKTMQPDRAWQSIMADLFEAVLGAIYLDGGLVAAEWFIFHHFTDEFKQVLASPPRNWKAELQEHVQRTHKEVPKYLVLADAPFTPDKMWRIAVTIKGELYGEGKGHSKKKAQQRAAWEALVNLGVEEPSPSGEPPAAVGDLGSTSGFIAADDILGSRDDNDNDDESSSEESGVDPVDPVAPFIDAPGEEFREIARQLAARFRERAPVHDRNGTVCEENFRELHSSGLLSLVVPESFGGWGGSMSEAATTLEELAVGDASTALCVAMHYQTVGGLAEAQLSQSPQAWPASLFDELCWAIVKDGAMINAAASEPELGSPARGGIPKTKALFDPSHQEFIIDGTKTWTTGAEALSYFIVPAAIVQQGETIGVGRFLVPRDTRGVRIERTFDAVAMRSTGSHDIHMESARIPLRYCINRKAVPAAPDPDRPPLVNPWFQAMVSAVYLGTARAALECAVDYAQKRSPTAMGGKAIAELESVQRQVGRCRMLILESQSSLYQATDWWQRYGNRPEVLHALVSAKSTVTNNAIDVTQRCLRVVGGAGLMRNLPLERYLRDALAGIAHPVQDDQAEKMLGKWLLDNSA